MHGRDRTGMVLMLLLANAGTPPEGLAQDYAASAYAMASDEREVPTIDERAGWSDAEVVAHLARMLSHWSATPTKERTRPRASSARAHRSGPGCAAPSWPEPRVPRATKRRHSSVVEALRGAQPPAGASCRSTGQEDGTPSRRSHAREAPR
ncbi:tyrosine-protein phosphatase [Actinomyces israelii]|uniref:tyrosine-protein phosphatase n=1 Tax=Actinomyces israelii TaxID=1659 RepID=UPI003C6CB6C2